MSRAAFLKALEKHGPLSAARLADLLCLPSGQIARRAMQLRRMGRVIRVDGRSGRGSVAVHALPGTITTVKAKATRGDLGCKHQAPRL